MGSYPPGPKRTPNRSPLPHIRRTSERLARSAERMCSYANSPRLRVQAFGLNASRAPDVSPSAEAPVPVRNPVYDGGMQNILPALVIGLAIPAAVRGQHSGSPAKVALIKMPYVGERNTAERSG